MITEDYVSSETAKLLEEKGFNGQCFMFENIVEKTFGTEWNTESTYSIPIPTIQTACKWLETKKHIAIIPVLSSILDNEKFLWDVKIVIAKTGETYSQGWIYESREQSCEAGLKYTLKNLI